MLRATCLFAGGISLATACSSAAGSSSDETPPRATLELSVIEPSTLPTTAAVPTSPPVTQPPSTTRPATTAVSPTTVAPSTSAPEISAPAVTATEPAAPTTTLPFIPKNFAAVSDMTAQPYSAVGNDNGQETKRIQSRLIEMGFWLNSVDGKYGLATSQAVMAFQKYAGLRASGAVDRATADALTTAIFRASAAATDGSMVEIDKRKQLLFLVDHGRTTWVFNTSTGNGKFYSEVNLNTGRIEEDHAITPDGLWKITRERPDGWWEGDLGKIYRPKYFVGGIAIHGMHNVPNYPASHGCVRLSLPAMDYIWNNGLIPKGTTVWVHGGDEA